MVQIWKARQLAEMGHTLWPVSEVGTYSLKQCAAETSQVLLMRVAPQRWMLLYCRLACQGQSPVSAEDRPPTMRSDDDLAIDFTDLFCRSPQTAGRGRGSVSCSSAQGAVHSSSSGTHCLGSSNTTDTDRETNLPPGPHLQHPHAQPIPVAT